MSIFINIASWEDPTLIRTIKTAMTNADNPNDLMFSLALAYDEYPDLSFLPSSQYHEIRFDSKDRPGVQKARHLANQFYCKEDYYLMIDSHTIFSQGWDTDLINLITKIKKETKKEKVAISNLNGLASDKKSWIVSNNHNLAINTVSELIDQKEEYIPIVYVSAGFIFGNGEIAEIITDRYTSMGFEEFIYSWRLIMHDFSLFQALPGRIKVEHNTIEYHRYLKDKNLFNRNYSSEKYLAKDKDLHELTDFSYALVFNEYSILKIDNPKITPEQFWKIIGLESFYFRYFVILTDLLCKTNLNNE
jgi:hypothetical protein